LRSLADVILVGAATMRTEGYGPARLDGAAGARRQRSGLAPVPPIAVVTGACRLDWGSPFLTEAEQQPVVITASRPRRPTAPRLLRWPT
jgi:5-amino-6-(5-phosphoribosylamino)uracil reductase